MSKKPSEASSQSVRVKVSDLATRGGVLAEDVLSGSGAVLLPAGADLTLMEKSIGTVITKLQNENVEWVLLKPHQPFSADDIDRIVEKIYPNDDALLDLDETRKIVKQVDDLFQVIRKQDFTPEIVAPLTNMGKELAEGIVKNPSVAFSLGRVHNVDEYTFVHSFNVAAMTGFLAHVLYPNDSKYVERIVIGGLMHDIGKAQIPIEVLNKPGPLDNEEFAIMKKHPQLGLDMALAAGVTDNDILDVIIGHHEKWSGRGYPKGLAGEQIPKAARIGAVADVFDALTAQRVYKKGMPPKIALNIILADSVLHFDPAMVRGLLVGMGLYPPGSLVMLSNGAIAIVISSGGTDLISPVVSLQEDPKGKVYETPEFLDLKASDLYIVKHLGSYQKRAIV